MTLTETVSPSWSEVSLFRSKLTAIYYSQWDAIKVIDFSCFRLSPICLRDPVSQCHMFTSNRPMQMPKSRISELILTIWLGNGFMKIGPMHTDWCKHIVKSIGFDSSADYKTIYVVDKGSIYFWLDNTATQWPDWATGSESYMIYYRIFHT